MEGSKPEKIPFYIKSAVTGGFCFLDDSDRNHVRCPPTINTEKNDQKRLEQLINHKDPEARKYEFAITPKGGNVTQCDHGEKCINMTLQSLAGATPKNCNYSTGTSMHGKFTYRGNFDCAVGNSEQSLIKHFHGDDPSSFYISRPTGFASVEILDQKTVCGVDRNQNFRFVCKKEDKNHELTTIPLSQEAGMLNVFVPATSDGKTELVTMTGSL